MQGNLDWGKETWIGAKMTQGEATVNLFFQLGLEGIILKPLFPRLYHSPSKA